ncbi:MAG TPA: PilX N-terminal domain-containing pilus assembly protein [Thermoanaerobaculia bacterium]|jgi:hypothetical protein
MTIRANLLPSSRPPRRNQRGAALILTVVVVMVLTTLALTMATFTTTEERTANTYRDSMQTRAVAEAGVRIVQEMFRNPGDRELVPLYSSAGTIDDPAWDYWGANDATINTQLNEIGIWRKARPGANPPFYAGSNNAFFQPPFNGTWAAAFGGTYNPNPAGDSYDLKFNCRNPATGALIPNYEDTCWLYKFNKDFLVENGALHLDTGRITDISLYQPPIANGRAYGIATVRVTAEKRTDGDEGEILARETVEAVIIDLSQKPSVLGNGSIIFKIQAGTLCGDGCEQIHANGDAEVGTVTGGKDPMVTATGTVSGGATSKKDGAKDLVSPHINPWDLAYRPTNAAELNRYYLVAARRLDAIWRDGNPANNPPPRRCGLNNYTTCQDYNLEYTIADAEKPARNTTDLPYIYRWNIAANEWTECGVGLALACASGGPTFTVTRQNDTIVPAGTDTNSLPFNRTRVPQTVFQIQNAFDGATVLVDGRFFKQGNMVTTMTIISVGSLSVQAQTTWSPAMSNRAMWISGRDILTQANCCAPTNQCQNNLGIPSAAGIMAAHEQIQTGAQNALLGLVIAENIVTNDPTVPGPLAINSDNGDHGSLCNLPDWPWTIPVRPGLASIKSAAN